MVGEHPHASMLVVNQRVQWHTRQITRVGKDVPVIMVAELRSMFFFAPMAHALLKYEVKVGQFGECGPSTCRGLSRLTHFSN